MQPSDPPTRIVLTLAVRPDPFTPWAVRLRRALKTLGRAYGLRCVRWEVIESEPKKEDLPRGNG